jgi:hypothetical protein
MSSPYTPTEADIESALQQLLRFTARYVALPEADRRSIAYTYATTWARCELDMAEHGSDVSGVIRHTRAMLAALDRWTPYMRPARFVDEPASEVTA